MNKFILIILFFCTNILYANTVAIDDTTEQLEILTSSQIYIDKTKKLTIDDIAHKDIEFQDNDKELLSYGYSPDFDVWVKFTLKNTSDKPIQKILEYGNSLTTDVVFYDLKKNISYQDGLLNTSSTRSSVNPIFEITLNPNEANTYYIKASSYVTTMIIKLKLWDYNIFYGNELKHQVILALFFGAMVVLAIYNLFVYFFTKDISYLFYVLYIFGISVHHTLYVGAANIYLVNQVTMGYIVEFASLFIAFPIFFLALFSKTFLQVNNYLKLNLILNILLILFPITVSVFLITDEFNKYRNIFSILVLLYLIIITIYLVFKKNRQAYFVIFGWLILAVGGLSMYLSSTGILNIYNNFP